MKLSLRASKVSNHSCHDIHAGVRDRLDEVLLAHGGRSGDSFLARRLTQLVNLLLAQLGLAYVRRIRCLVAWCLGHWRAPLTSAPDAATATRSRMEILSRRQLADTTPRT